MRRETLRPYRPLPSRLPLSENPLSENPRFSAVAPRCLKRPAAPRFVSPRTHGPPKKVPPKRVSPPSARGSACGASGSQLPGELPTTRRRPQIRAFHSTLAFPVSVRLPSAKLRPAHHCSSLWEQPLYDGSLPLQQGPAPSFYGSDSLRDIILLILETPTPQISQAVSHARATTFGGLGPERRKHSTGNWV